MRLPVHLVRVSGYLIIAIILIALFKDDTVGAHRQSLFFLFIPIWAWCGWRLAYYKEKAFPLSRAESIFSKTAEIGVIIFVVLRIGFLLLAK